MTPINGDQHAHEQRVEDFHRERDLPTGEEPVDGFPAVAHHTRPSAEGVRRSLSAFLGFPMVSEAGNPNREEGLRPPPNAKFTGRPATNGARCEPGGWHRPSLAPGLGSERLLEQATAPVAPNHRYLAAARCRARVRAAFRADADRAAAGRAALAAPPSRPPFFDGARLTDLSRPDPDFLPPWVSAFTVAQARRSASRSGHPAHPRTPPCARPSVSAFPSKRSCLRVASRPPSLFGVVEWWNRATCPWVVRVALVRGPGGRGSRRARARARPEPRPPGRPPVSAVTNH